MFKTIFLLFFYITLIYPSNCNLININILANKKDNTKSISEFKSPLTVSGRAWARKNCMFGEIISNGGI